MAEAKAEAKKIELTLGERIAALRILNAFKGDMPTLKSILDDVKQLPVTEEEWKEAGLVKTPAKDAEGNAVENWAWDEGKVAPKEVTLQPEVAKYLKDQIKQKSDANDITTADAALITLDSKL